MPKIVTVTVSQQVASAPSKLQSTGAFVCQGATTSTIGQPELITQASDLTAIWKTEVPLASLAAGEYIVTATASTAHGITIGQTVKLTIQGVTPVGYEGTFDCTATTSTAFTYETPVGLSTGTASVPGSYIPDSVSELTAMVDTFFGQGANQAVYVLDLGLSDSDHGVAALSDYIDNPVIRMYAYMLPAAWDTETTAPALALQHENTTAAVYFWVTTTPSTYTPWANIKSVMKWLQSPDAPATEFSAAAPFQAALSTTPSTTQLVAPFSFRYLYGVTPYVLTNSQQTTLSAAGLNWAGTGAEGGISNKMIVGGNMGDGNPWNYWYAVDWVVINEDLDLSAEIFNGSNNPGAPLYYDQPGINRLLKRAQNTINNGISFGMILSPAVVTAVPVKQYVGQHPGDYAAGIYSGLACSFTPRRGFTAITLSLTAYDIPL